MKTIVLLTALGLVSAAAIAAPDAGHPHERFFERLKAADTNGDGMISREEAAALPRLAKHFDAIDANHDGQITREELKAYGEQRRAEHWKRIDSDGDGRISRAEAQANAPRLAAHFDQIDANGDGFITPEEMRAAHQHHHRGQYPM